MPLCDANGMDDQRDPPKQDAALAVTPGILATISYDGDEYPLIIEPDRECGGFVVTCAAMPGCISQGETEGEAIANMADAACGWLLADGVSGVSSITLHLRMGDSIDPPQQDTPETAPIKTELGRSLWELRARILAKRVQLLDWDDVDREIEARRHGEWQPTEKPRRPAPPPPPPPPNETTTHGPRPPKDE